MRSSQIRHVVVATLIGAALPMVSAAADSAWYDDAPLSSFGAGAWTPTYAAFSLDGYRSTESVVDFYTDHVLDSEARAPTDLLRVFSTVDQDFTRGAASFRSSGTDAESLAVYRPRRFGVAWQHRLDDMNHFTVSADHGAAAPLFGSVPEVADTRATVSLTSHWRAAYRPRVTGSVFVGGESTSPETHRVLGRRYYGLAVGGELTLARAHTPYVSFQMQRSLSQADDALATPMLDDDRSQIAAGWKWQAQRHLSLQAEASVGYNGSRLRFQNPEHSRVFFGTRFDFR